MLCTVHIKNLDDNYFQLQNKVSSRIFLTTDYIPIKIAPFIAIKMKLQDSDQDIEAHIQMYNTCSSRTF